MRFKNPIQTCRDYFSFYGWRMVLVGCLFRFLGGGFHFYGFTVFALPLQKDLGINRAATGLVFGLARAEGALEGPLAGYLIDRFGPRPIMMVAVLLTGLGYMLLYWVDSYWTLLILYLGVVSLAFGAGFMHCPMVLANSWFSRYRARAMALVSCSIGVGGALLAPVLAYVVHYYGWRWGMVLAGAVFLGLGTPLAAVVRRSPEDMGLAPDGDIPSRPTQEPGQPAESGAAPAEADIGVWEAVRGAPFWLLVVSTLFRVLGLSTVIAHFVQIMVWKGVGELAASWFLSVFAALSLPTHLVVGWLADRHDKARLNGRLHGGGGRRPAAAHLCPKHTPAVALPSLVLPGGGRVSGNLGLGRRALRAEAFRQGARQHGLLLPVGRADRTRYGRRHLRHDSEL